MGAFGRTNIVCVWVSLRRAMKAKRSKAEILIEGLHHEIQKDLHHAVAWIEGLLKGGIELVYRLGLSGGEMWVK